MSMKYWSIFCLFVFGGMFYSALYGQHIRLMHYNLLNFGSSGACPSTNTRIDYLNTILGEVNPDIFTVNELKVNLSGGENTRANKILEEVFNQNSSTFSRATDTYQSTGDQVNMVFYNNQKFEMYAQDQITEDLNGNQLTRLIDIYRFYYKENIAIDTIFFEVIVAHLKASSSVPDALERATQTAAIMAYINANDLSDNIILAGDLNVYTSVETAFLNLINPSSGLKFNDPIEQLGPWHLNSDFAEIHTQSTRENDGGCGSSGGMNDRFDFILYSDAVKNGSDGILGLSTTYKAFGQDGTYFNDDLDQNGNSEIDSDVASALFNMSDHLPVLIDFYMDINFTSVQREISSGLIEVVTPIREWIVFNTKDLESNAFTLKLFDISGKQVHKEKLKNRFGWTEVKANHLPSGIYMLKIEEKNGDTHLKKIVK